MIRELKTFVVVAREGTFAAAGLKVGLTQAAVSAQMRRLESTLGFPLFERTGRAAHLNPMGHQILARAHELIRLYDDLRMCNIDRAAATFLSIGAIASVQRFLLPEVLARFHKQCPACRTRVVPGLSMELIDLVDAGEIDMAATIRPSFALQSDLEWTTLAREPFRLVVPRHVEGDDWITLLSSQPFVRYDRTSLGGRQVDRFLRQAQVSLQEVCEADELDAIVRLVANCVGIALVPQTAALRHWPAAVRAIDLGPDTFYREIGLIRQPSGNLSERALLLAQLLCAAYGGKAPDSE